MEPLLTQDQLLALLRQTFGTQVALIACTIGKQRHDYLVLLAQLEHPSVEVVIKLAGPEAPLASSFDRTAMLHRLVAAQTTIPMPEVFAVDVSRQTWPWRYFIRAHIPGEEWVTVQPQLNEEELSNAYGQLGEAVGQLHGIHFPLFGDIAADGRVWGGESAVVALAEHAESCIKYPRSRELFLSALDERRHLFSDVRQVSLCHEDLHKYNILFQFREGRWQLATILDFDKAWAGHRETDLARLELWRGMTSDAFWRAYEALCPLEPLYAARRPLYQLLWCLEFAQPTAEHLADTRRVCAELGLPPVERFE